MELRQLKYFIAIAEAKSYSTAAKNLFITQPTLSWNVQKLEDELHSQLFYQSSNNVLELTDTGELLYKEGKQILNSLESLIYSIQTQDDRKKEILKVGITALFVIQYMNEIIRFTSDYPNVELVFVQSGSIDIQRKLVNDEIDIGLCSYPLYEPELKMEKLNTSTPHYKISVVMPKSHVLAERESLTVADLEGHPICAFSDDYVLNRVLYDRAHSEGFKPNVIFTNGEWEVLLQNVLATQSLALMPHFIKKIRAEDDLKWIPLDDKANLFKIGVASRKNEKLKNIAIQFINYIKQN